MLLTKSNIDDNDLPNDVYSEVCKTVIDQIDKIEDVKLKNVLSKIKIDRKLLKKPVMTVPYNVSLSSMADQLVQDGFF